MKNDSSLLPSDLQGRFSLVDPETRPEFVLADLGKIVLADITEDTALQLVVRGVLKKTKEKKSANTDTDNA